MTQWFIGEAPGRLFCESESWWFKYLSGQYFYHGFFSLHFAVASRSLREGGETGILMWPLPDNDNTMVNLLKLSPPTQSYQ